jgi:hypothetical protein
MSRSKLLTAVVEDSNRKQDLVREVLDDLRAPDADVRMTRHQLRAMREELDRMERELEVRPNRVPAALVARSRRSYRELFNVGSSAIDRASFLARCLNNAVSLALGTRPEDCLLTVLEAEAVRLAASSLGVGDIALSLFAMAYPEDAAKIDRRSLDRLVTAWTAAFDGGRWPVLESVCRKRLRIQVSATAIKEQTRKYPASTFEDDDLDD